MGKHGVLLVLNKMVLVIEMKHWDSRVSSTSTSTALLSTRYQSNDRKIHPLNPQLSLNPLE